MHLFTNRSNFKTGVLKARSMMIVSMCTARTLPQKNTLSSSLNTRLQEERRLCLSSRLVRQLVNLMKKASFSMKWRRGLEKMSLSQRLTVTCRYQLWSTVTIGWLCPRHLASQQSAPIRLRSMLMETKGIRELKGHRTAPLLGILSLRQTRISK